MTRPHNPFTTPIGCERPHARLKQAVLFHAAYNAEVVAARAADELVDYDGV